MKRIYGIIRRSEFEEFINGKTPRVFLYRCDQDCWEDEDENDDGQDLARIEIRLIDILPNIVDSSSPTLLQEPLLKVAA